MTTTPACSAWRIRRSRSYSTTAREPVTQVSENGPGIAPDLRETVFVPFFTTRREGTGIGLTLARQIAAVHGATLELHNTDGGGATFLLRFG